MATTLRTATERLMPGDETLEAFVIRRRGEGTAWRIIAREVYEMTGVDIAYETLRGWFPEAKAS